VALAIGAQVGGVLPAVWITLAVSRSWRPESSWLDRVGIVLGSYFIVAFMIAPFVLSLML
jgi:hypothetical protein